jgi:hypothetical protein
LHLVASDKDMGGYIRPRKIIPKAASLWANGGRRRRRKEKASDSFAGQFLGLGTQKAALAT